MRILIAEDNLMMRRFLTRLVAGSAEVVCECGDGSSAVALYRDFLPDIVLMDIRMPSMDGLEATRRIVAEHPEAVVLIVTEHDEESYRRSARECGASAYFLKDSLEELHRALEERINNAA